MQFARIQIQTDAVLKYQINVRDEKPIAKARPRAFRCGNSISLYDPQKSETGYFRLLVKDAVQGSPPLSGALILAIVFCFERPKSHFRTGKFSGEIRPAAPAFHIVKPDADNLTKYVKDAFNGIVWKDDKQVVGEYIEKVYADENATRIAVWELAGK